jgi:hypothetical protein
LDSKNSRFSSDSFSMKSSSFTLDEDMSSLIKYCSKNQLKEQWIHQETLG